MAACGTIPQRSPISRLRAPPGICPRTNARSSPSSSARQAFAVAGVLGRAASTVSREIARNSPEAGGYRPALAQRLATTRLGGHAEHRAPRYDPGRSSHPIQAVSLALTSARSTMPTPAISHHTPAGCRSTWANSCGERSPASEWMGTTRAGPRNAASVRSRRRAGTSRVGSQFLTEDTVRTQPQKLYSR